MPSLLCKYSGHKLYHRYIWLGGGPCYPVAVRRCKRRKCEYMIDA